MSHAPADDDARFPFARVSNVALVAAILFAALALRRFITFHNETFDLAFYARLTWGLGRGNLYQPLTQSSFLGLHASPILFVPGLLSWIFPVVPLLLVVQAATVAAAGIPLARIAARRIGHPLAADIALLVYLLYPSISTLATYEFHPSALALFPLALALDYLDRRLVRRGMIALVVAAACREDVALIAAFVGLALAVRAEHRRAGLLAFTGFGAYFALYIFVIAPRYLPEHGSFDLHYGSLGGSPASIVRALFTHPIATLASVTTKAKLLYGPRLLLPVAFLPLLAPRWLLPAIVPFGINYLSGFPTAVQIQSHYAALTVPFLIASAAHGAGRLAASSRAVDRVLAVAGLAVALGTLHMHHRAGATPLSRRWDPGAFRSDARAREARAALALIPPDARVAAPDYVLPHLAERLDLDRVPWRGAREVVMLDASHRARFGQTQELWRSSEEALVRNTLAAGRYGLYAVTGRFLLLRRGQSPRAFARGRYIAFTPGEGARAHHIEVGPSLALAGWGIRSAPGGSIVTLFLVAKERLPRDLGLELGWGPMHPAGDRQDPADIVAALPFDGLFSPAHVRPGEVARTEVFVPVAPGELRGDPLYFGARRWDGSRLDPESPHWVELTTAP